MSKNIEKGSLTSEFVLDHIDGNEAFLISGEDKLVVSKSLLPKGINDGEIIHATFSTAEAEKKRNEQKAKDILNEILKG